MLLAGLVATMAVAVWAGRVPEAGVAIRVLTVAALLAGSGLGIWAALRGTWSMRWVLGAAVILRLVSMPMAPTLSDDAYRYLWDGGLTVAGVSPYSHRPDADVLVPLRQEETMAHRFERMNSPSYYTVYPPLSQAVFAASASVPGRASWYVLKGLLVLVEGLGVWAMSRVVSARRMAWYALSPVAALEVAGQGHTEGLLVGAVGVMWWALVQGRYTTVGWAIVAAGWVKLYPFALGALLIRRLGPVAFGGIALVALMLGSPLLIGDGLVHLLESVQLYGGALDFYAAPYLALKASLYALSPQGAGRLAASLLTLGWLATVMWAWRRDQGTVAGARRLVAVVLVGYALQSPMVHPWNALGALALVPALTLRLPLAWLVAVSPLTYVRYVGMETVYFAAIGIGWGGAGLLWLLSYYRNPARIDSGEAVAASTQG